MKHPPLATPQEIEKMTLTEIASLRKDIEIKNLIYHYNTTRDQATEPSVYIYEGGNLMHPSEGFRYSVYFERRGETSENTPPLVRFTTLTEVRTFILALLALRKFKV
jgi:hypothetical protein